MGRVAVAGRVAVPEAGNLLGATDLLGVAWTPTRGVVASGVGPAPDGSMTAYRFTDDLTSGSHIHQWNIAYNLPVGIRCTSIYIKPETLAMATLRVTSNGWGSTYDFSTSPPTLTAPNLAIPPSKYNWWFGAGVADAGNGWFRIWNTVFGGGGPGVGPVAGNIDLSQTLIYLGSQSHQGASQTLLLWGPQVSPTIYPIPYVANASGAAIVRNTRQPVRPVNVLASVGYNGDRIASGVVFSARAETGITLGATPRASGTAPPVVTFSGNLTASLGIRVEIQTTAALGVATFRYSADNGATWIESGKVTAATYAMIGAAAGIVLNFPAGAYTNNNVYQATVAAWMQKSPFGVPLTQATASKQPLYSMAGGPGGRPCLVFDGVTQVMQAAFPLVQPYTVEITGKYNANFAAADTLFDGVGSVVNNPGRCFRQGAGTQLAISAGSVVAATVTDVITTAWHFYNVKFAPFAGSIAIDGTSVASGNSGSQIPYNGGGLSIGAGSNGTTQPGNISVADVTVVRELVANNAEASYGGNRILQL